MIKVSHRPFFNWELWVQRLSPDVLNEGPTERKAVMSTLYLHVVDLLTRFLINIVGLDEALPLVGDQIQLYISGDLDHNSETQVHHGLTPDGIAVYESVGV